MAVDPYEKLRLARIATQDLIRRTGLGRAAIATRLADTTRIESPADLRAALELVFASDGFEAEHSNTLAVLVVADWHMHHEDVAKGLQRVGDATSVEPLARAARMKHAYMAHDESHAFARKCVWALADVGTAEARRHIEALAAGDDAEVAGYARRRLDRWDVELPRKRHATR